MEQLHLSMHRESKGPLSTFLSFTSLPFASGWPLTRSRVIRRAPDDGDLNDLLGPCLIRLTRVSVQYPLRFGGARMPSKADIPLWSERKVQTGVTLALLSW
jgi:hypothetical protein